MPKKIVVLVGFARSGKDVIGDFLVNNKLDLSNKQKYIRVAFADALKDTFCYTFNISREYLENHKDLYREALINMGEGARKDDPLHWIELVKDKIENCEDNIVITDLRRIPEVEYLLGLKEKGIDVEIIHLVRPKDNGGIFENDKDTALTLQYLDYHSYIDKKIVNDKDITYLLSKIVSYI